jgi:hypothetical protein
VVGNWYDLRLLQCGLLCTDRNGPSFSRINTPLNLASNNTKSDLPGFGLGGIV